MSLPRHIRRSTRGRMAARLGVSCGLLFCAGALLGITQCSATCTDPETGEKYQCTRCESDDQNGCTEDLWYLPDWGTECTESNRPTAEDGTECAAGFGVCQTGSCRGVFPCTEQGILDAVAEGGGPHTFDCDGPTTVPLTGEIVIDKDLVLDGGGEMTLYRSAEGFRAISILEGATVALSGITVTGVEDYIGPRGTYCLGILNQGVLTLVEGAVRENWSPNAGSSCAGICAYGPTTLIDSHVERNLAEGGAGVCGSVRLVGSSISNNTAYWGSAVDGDVELIESTISGNDPSFTVHGQSGTVVAGRLYAYRSAIIHNYAGNGSLAGETTLINSTVSGNIALSGIGARLVLNSTLVAGPHPRVYGDDYDLTTNLVRGDGLIANSLIVNPYPAPSQAPFVTRACGGSLVSGGGNIESPEDTCGLSEPTDLSNVTEAQLNLGPLGDYGGPTRTHGLLPRSVAIDHVPASMCLDENGDPLGTDQRGIARPQGAACDAGAYEVQP